MITHTVRFRSHVTYSSTTPRVKALKPAGRSLKDLKARTLFNTALAEIQSRIESEMQASKEKQIAHMQMILDRAISRNL